MNMAPCAGQANVLITYFVTISCSPSALGKPEITPKTIGHTNRILIHGSQECNQLLNKYEPFPELWGRNHLMPIFSDFLLYSHVRKCPFEN
jgi:hypothetical protein